MTKKKKGGWGGGGWKHAFKRIIENFIPLSDMQILGSSISAANKDMMSKTWTNGDTII